MVGALIQELHFDTLAAVAYRPGRHCQAVEAAVAVRLEETVVSLEGGPGSQRRESELHVPGAPGYRAAHPEREDDRRLPVQDELRLAAAGNAAGGDRCSSPMKAKAVLTEGVHLAVNHASVSCGPAFQGSSVLKACTVPRASTMVGELSEDMISSKPSTVWVGACSEA